MNFILFLLVNVALFLRPQDLSSSLAAIPFYNILIVANLIVAAPVIVAQLRNRPKQSPATVCVAGILAAIVLSLLARNDLGGAWHWGLEFAKVAAYFVLMVAMLSSVQRFTIYLASIVALTLVLTALSVAHFHGHIELAAITHARETAYDPLTGDAASNLRLAAFGVFADPNDLSMIIVVSMMICLGGVWNQEGKALRFALVAPLLFLGYALALTQSRGGLLALLAGLSAFFVSRFGVVRTTLAIAVLLPLLLYVYAGRQTDISGGIASGTGKQRTDLWHAGLQMLQWSPVVGMGHAQFVQEEGLVAHSSYIQALAEWGLVGGTMFIGLFYVVMHSVWRLKSVRASITSPALRRMHPYVLGALAAYVASMLTLTRCDVVPTYLVAGLGVSYERLARPGTQLAPVEFNAALVLRMFLVTLGFLLATYVYIRFVYRLF